MYVHMFAVNYFVKMDEEVVVDTGSVQEYDRHVIFSC